MKIVVFAIVNYVTLRMYEIEFENPIETVTPEFVRRIVKEGKIKGRAFIIIAGNRICYATKQNKQFYVKYLT